MIQLISQCHSSPRLVFTFACSLKMCLFGFSINKPETETSRLNAVAAALRLVRDLLAKLFSQTKTY